MECTLFSFSAFIHHPYMWRTSEILKWPPLIGLVRLSCISKSKKETSSQTKQKSFWKPTCWWLQNIIGVVPKTAVTKTLTLGGSIILEDQTATLERMRYCLRPNSQQCKGTYSTSWDKCFQYLEGRLTWGLGCSSPIFLNLPWPPILSELHPGHILMSSKLSLLIPCF